MSDRYGSYAVALRVAESRANSTGLDVAIRRTKEFGRDGYNVSFAARNDSDYARAEIVRPLVVIVPPEADGRPWTVVTAGPGRHLLAYRSTEREAREFAAGVQS